MGFASLRKLFIFLLASMLIQPLAADTHTLSELEVINQAAWQRTLVMRIAKSHIMLAAGVDYQKSKTDLAESIEFYEAGLKSLQNNSPNREISDRLRTVKFEWGRLKAAVMSSPTKENVQLVMDESDDLIYHTDAVVRKWKEYAEEQVGHLIDTSSQQSMLSERIGMFYAAHFYGLKNDWVISELNFALQTYENGLQELLSYNQNSKEIGDNIARLSNQWEYAKMSLEKFNAGQYLPHVIAITVDTMMHRSNKIANLYAVNQHIDGAPIDSLYVPGLASTIGGEFTD